MTRNINPNKYDVCVLYVLRPLAATARVLGRGR